MFFRFILYVGIIGLLLLIISRTITGMYARSRTESLESIAPMKIAIVFGAGLWRDGTPTPVLRDRITTAAELYFSGNVEKLLMSGDNRFSDYNEPASMQEFAISLGVPADDIVLDFAGRRTYDTCYRAREIFNVDEAILVTQGYHLPRALYTCNKLGIHAVGVSADRRQYRRGSLLYWNLRELLATFVALWQVHISQPLPVLGEPEPIFTNDSLSIDHSANN
jgi:vancomycin permeability regulator SanA